MFLKVDRTVIKLEEAVPLSDKESQNSKKEIDSCGGDTKKPTEENQENQESNLVICFLLLTHFSP